MEHLTVDTPPLSHFRPTKHDVFGENGNYSFFKLKLIFPKLAQIRL